MSRAWGGGSTRAWRILRREILVRDGYQCKIRIVGVCTGRATCVHHVRGKAHGDDPAYLQAACSPCNARVNDPSRVSTHQAIVAWVRAQGVVVSSEAVRTQFPRVSEWTIRKTLARAVQRKELQPRGRGRYVAGPTGLPPVLNSAVTPRGGERPSIEPRTQW